MTEASRQGKQRGLPVLKKLAMLMTTAGLAFPAFAGDLQAVAIRLDGNVLRLQLESEQGTLQDSGVTADGRQLVVVLKALPPTGPASSCRGNSRRARR